MKRIMTLVLAAGLTLGAVSQASAVDFKAKGQWIMGFGYVDTNFTPKVDGRKISNGDKFAAVQRVRLQMDVVASEALSGTVYFEIGDQVWGHSNGGFGRSSGGQLGTDGVCVEVKRAYLDWIVPNTNLSIRMGLQGVAMPNVAGGSAILDDDVAALAATYKFNDTVSLTAAWMRAFNDNWPAQNFNRSDANYLDNFDGFMLALPVTADGFSITPWVAYAISGKNVVPEGPSDMQGWYGLHPVNRRGEAYNNRSRAYNSMFFAGLPISITAFDPLNIEVDINYGYSEGFGRYNAWDYRFANLNDPVVGGPGWLRANSQRSGWLVKALLEYKMDWGTPGLFGWYGSGDDGNQKNGSERMPFLSPCGNFTSFIGDGDINGWSIHNARWGNMGYDMMMSYSGTWGIGAQIKDMSFLEGLKHTLRVAYWGGTNSPSMVKYIGSSTYATDSALGGGIFYLTTNDGLLEVNLDSTWQIYDNLTATLELGYIGNLVDKGTWKRSFYQPFERGDAYKAALIFAYNF